jgi:hypothetical protein
VLAEGVADDSPDSDLEAVAESFFLDGFLPEPDELDPFESVTYQPDPLN